jgi:hypothetical protein
MPAMRPSRIALPMGHLSWKNSCQDHASANSLGEYRHVGRLGHWQQAVKKDDHLSGAIGRA